MTHCDPYIAWDESQLLGVPKAEGDSTSGARRILLVGLSHDLELATIARKLGHRGATVRVLLLDYISSQPSWQVTAATAAAPFDVGYCRAYRSERPVPYHFDRTLRQSLQWASVDHQVRPYVADQVNTLFWALVGSYDVGTWINSPWNVRAAENKLTQLEVASQCGLGVPQTLVTSQYDEADKFISQFKGGVVSKSLDSPVVRQGETSSEFRYTEPLGSPVALDLTYPRLLQERIGHDEELRLTVIGDRIFAAKVRTPDAGLAPDWRQARSNHGAFGSTLIPAQLRGAIGLLMNSLNLQVGGIDLLRAGNDTYFLEVNPSCGYLWLERLLEIEISETLVQFLMTT